MVKERQKGWFDIKNVGEAAGAPRMNVTRRMRENQSGCLSVESTGNAECFIVKQGNDQPIPNPMPYWDRHIHLLDRYHGLSDGGHWTG